jgi:hypothetical protein
VNQPFAAPLGCYCPSFFANAHKCLLHPNQLIG